MASIFQLEEAKIHHFCFSSQWTSVSVKWTWHKILIAKRKADRGPCPYIQFWTSVSISETLRGVRSEETLGSVTGSSFQNI